MLAKIKLIQRVLHDSATTGMAHGTATRDVLMRFRYERFRLGLAADGDSHELADFLTEARLAEGAMEWPANWAIDPHPGSTRPQRGEIELTPKQHKDEFWEVFRKLRAPPLAAVPTLTGNADGPGPKVARDGQKSAEIGMTDAWMVKLQRIQNEELFAFTDFQKERIAKTMQVGDKKDVAIAELKKEVPVWEGWHGTGGFCASNIYRDDQDGFMMQFSSQGQWGKGLYFARDAGYSDFYATKAGQIADRHDLQEGEKEMMLADLVLGNVIEMDRNVSGNAARTDPAMDACCRELTAPPAMNGCKVKRAYDGVDRCKGPPEHGGTKDQGHKYNTVRGYTQTDRRMSDGTWNKNPDCPSSQVHIVYENGRAYPKYLVTYYRGDYDPARVTRGRGDDPLYTQEEAAAELSKPIIGFDGAAGSPGKAVQNSTLHAQAQASPVGKAHAWECYVLSAPKSARTAAASRGVHLRSRQKVRLQLNVDRLTLVDVATELSVCNWPLTEVPGWRLRQGGLGDKGELSFQIERTRKEVLVLETSKAMGANIVQAIESHTKVLAGAPRRKPPGASPLAQPLAPRRKPRPGASPAQRPTQGVVTNPLCDTRYCHRGPDHRYQPYDDEDNAIIVDALSRGLETVQLAVRNDANGQALRFEVRFGSKAVSAKLNQVPDSGMIQVNMDTQMTRVVEEVANVDPSKVLPL